MYMSLSRNDHISDDAYGISAKLTQEIRLHRCERKKKIPKNPIRLFIDISIFFLSDYE